MTFSSHQNETIRCGVAYGFCDGIFRRDSLSNDARNNGVRGSGTAGAIARTAYDAGIRRLAMDAVEPDVSKRYADRRE